MAAIRKHHASALGSVLSGISFPMLLIIASMLVGVAALLPLVQSSGATSTAGTIQQLELEKADWRARTRQLELEIATLGSLIRIEQEASSRLKIVAPKDVRYIRVDSAPPEERRLPSRFLPAETKTTKDDSSSLWDDLFGWIPTP